jgi:hypothetical protein
MELTFKNLKDEMESVYVKLTENLSKLENSQKFKTK